MLSGWEGNCRPGGKVVATYRRVDNLGPVHTSNNVEATGNIFAKNGNNIHMSKQHSTLSKESFNLQHSTMLPGHLLLVDGRADCLYTRISSGPNTQ